MPSVSSLCMNPCVTTLAKTYKVGSVMCTTFRERGLVMYFFYFNKHSLLKAQLTKGMGLNITVTDAFPRSTITPVCCRVSVVLLVLFVSFLLVLLTEPSFSKVGTAGMVAWVFSLSWHSSYTSILGIIKALTAGLPL